MDYDLALQLKNAGFPQEGKGNYFGIGPNVVPEEVHTVYFPTLSELIDFVDGSDKLKDIEDKYVQKTLLKLQGGKNK